MKDRTPTYAGRVQLVPVTGQTNIYDMTMADEPTEAGTPLNKANLMSDSAAAAVWPVAGDRPADPTPSAAFIELAGRVKQLCDYTNTASISSSSSATITLSDNIENYKMLDIWAISDALPTNSQSLYIDVGDAVDATKRIGSVSTRTSATPNPIHLETLFADNSISGHLVVSDISRGYRSSEYPDPNLAFSGTSQLTGNKLTLSVSASSISSGKIRIIVIGHSF